MRGKTRGTGLVRTGETGTCTDLCGKPSGGVLQVLVAWAILAGCGCALAQTDARCGAEGYRVIALRADALLDMAYELRQDCAHPDRPSRLVAVGPALRAAETRELLQGAKQGIPAGQPMMVRAGETVRLWMQDAMVRIEMEAVAEGPARAGERVMVRQMRQGEDGAISVQHFAGIVRGPGDVEMEP